MNKELKRIMTNLAAGRITETEVEILLKDKKSSQKQGKRQKRAVKKKGTIKLREDK